MTVVEAMPTSAVSNDVARSDQEPDVSIVGTCSITGRRVDECLTSVMAHNGADNELICVHDATVNSLTGAIDGWRPHMVFRPGDTTCHFASLRVADRFLRHHAGGEAWLRHGTMMCNDVRRHVEFVGESPPGWAGEFLAAASAAVAGVHPDVWRRLSLPMSVACRAVVRCDERGVELAAALLVPRLTGDGHVDSIRAAWRLVIRRPRLVLGSVMRRPPTR